MSNFPDFNFKIDCGDDPKVRQWLHDNGKYWQSGDLLILSALERSRLYVEGETVSANISKSFFDRNPLPLINPYDYMQPEPTIAERMAKLIDDYGLRDIGDARYVMVDPSGYIYVANELMEVGQAGFLSDSETAWATPISQTGDKVLIDNWLETLTEIKPGAIEQDRGTIDNNDEMIKRDQAGMPKVNIKYTPPAKRLTIPSICLADQAMPMLLGGNFGAMNND
jgi:hypothetical protein